MSDLDLLGDPIAEERDPRGRPLHLVTDKKRSYVVACIAANWTREEIAAAIGVTPKTLTKHYSRELRGGKAMLRAKALMKLQEEVDKGNVSAIRLALSTFDKADAERDRPERPRRAPKPGKKEIAREDALHAHETGDWGDDLAPIPSRVIN